MRIEIATNSIEKINGIKLAFSRYFNIEESSIEVSNKKVDSGVPEQPFNDETYIGALNRVNTLIENSEKVDYYISCEAGIEEILEKYLNIQVVCIYDVNENEYFFGKSSGWQIPSKDIVMIKNSNLDNYLKNKGITSIEQLLGSNFSREKAIAEATELALASKKLI